MIEEEKQLGCEPSVTEDDIQQLLSRAEAIEKRLAENKDVEREYHVFDPSSLSKTKELFLN